MGYCISEGDFSKTGLAAGEVDAEARRESFVLNTEDHAAKNWGGLELLYTDIPRLKQLIAFLEAHYCDTTSDYGLPERMRRTS